MFEIEKGIPIPRRKYPLDELEIGDSFFIPFNEEKPINVRARLSPTMARIKNATGKVFVSKKATKDGKEGLRVWRSK